MTPSDLEKYIKRNSFTRIQNNAKNIVLTPLEENENYYLFKYKGSLKLPYTVEVELRPKIKTSCNCPYNDGLCKHEIAALKYIIDKLENVEIRQLNLFGEEQSHREIKLPNGTFTEELINEINSEFFEYRWYTYSHFERIKPQFITAETRVSKNVTTQRISYDSETETLKLKCSCQKFKTKRCRHIYSVLEKIYKEYGPSFFHPSYRELQIKNFLESEGFDPEIDYSSFYDFTFDNEKLKVTPLIQNIVSLDEFKKSRMIKVSSDLQGIIHSSSVTIPLPESQMGIGLCINLNQNRYGADLFAFEGKYKKNTQILSSKFREIDEYNFLEKTETLTTEEKSWISQINLLEKYAESLYNPSRTNASFYLKGYKLVREILKNQQIQIPVFYKKAEKGLFKKHLTEILEVSEETPEFFFIVEEKNGVYSLKPKMKLNNQSYQLNSKQLIYTDYFVIKDQIIYFYKTPYDYLQCGNFFEDKEFNFIKEDFLDLYENILEPLSKNFSVEYRNIKLPVQEKTEKESLKKEVYISEFQEVLVSFRPVVRYNDKHEVSVFSKEKLYDSETQKFINRDLAFENNFLEDFKELHPDFEQQDGIFTLVPYQLVEDEWLLKASDKMKQKNIELFGAKDLKSFKYSLHKPVVSMSVKSDIDWFDLKIEIKYGREKISLKEIRKAIVNNKKFIQLNDGTLGVLPQEWIQKFSKYFKSGEVRNDTVKISNYQFNIIDELFEELTKKPQFLLKLQEKKHRLKNLATETSAKIPKEIKATLRPYQKEGFDWLIFLHQNELGGCLADDMGLGKTLQTITFLQYLKTKTKNKLPSLVIAPTSLIFNWKKEIEKFCPTLSTLIYTGSKRKNLLDDFKNTDVILSTYGSLLNDISFLKDEKFNYLILDESQAIKNPNSKRYKAVRLIDSFNRLALTGTPIENNTFDLYSQMNFLNPGLLGSRNHFKTEFSDAIDKEQDKEAAELLSQMIHPFLLRRTKEQVATDLPDKTESILYCDMGKDQRKVYEHFKDKYRDYLLNKVEENGAEKAQMYVLEGLTKLRQICNSPELLNEEEDYGASSIKLDILIEDIKNKTAQHKILVFSQFTSMLSLVKTRLEDENISYEYLDGSTRNREEKVDTFQSNDQIRVFLISLKAGGTGLNLTAADYVYLIDPWWNPAVENQAIDRCYRIGQKKHVIAYKMICRDTIEEKIVSLQDNKKEISKSIIHVDKIKKSFNKEEIKNLFS